jgi:hypothetical protein
MSNGRFRAYILARENVVLGKSGILSVIVTWKQASSLVDMPQKSPCVFSEIWVVFKWPSCLHRISMLSSSLAVKSPGGEFFQ